MLTRTPLPFRHPAIWLATWFGAGLLPKAPGTWGSLAALPFAWAISEAGGGGLLAAAVALVSVVGWWAAERYAKASGDGDPGPVVIDEVAGQWLVLTMVPPGLAGYALGFVLFRLFDIVKPWPVSWADRQLKGGLGIMLDDLLAGLYGLAVLALLRLWWPI
ncbi:MAG TPA: phosphatidylglycerophosphatase A [Rhodospirillaceae bacterium]|nr:phosphatidylglycerophosphatase A [Rhodospirillaceae bacterium]